jgi:outer membrane putative beta-barrel porin/alpha-amylase
MEDTILKQVVVLAAVLVFLVVAKPALAEDPEVQQRTPPQPGSVPSVPKPKIQGSMVGYIDDALIASQVRIRFEAGFHAQFPDRAEFFYAKCGCYSQLAGSGLPNFDPKAPGSAASATDLNFQQLYFEGEYAPSSRFSFFAEAPIRWLQPKSFAADTGTSGNQSGFGDVRAGVKVGVLSSENGDSVLTGQFKSYFPTGDARHNLGVNHYSVEPALLFYQRLGSRASIESQFSFWHPIGGSSGVATPSNPRPGSFAGNVLSYGVGPSIEVYRTDRVRFAPVVELVGWSVRGGFQTSWMEDDNTTVSASGTNIVNLKVGARTAIGPRNSFYIGYGHALTNAVWYNDLVRAEYRFTF